MRGGGLFSCSRATEWRGGPFDAPLRVESAQGELLPSERIFPHPPPRKYCSIVCLLETASA